MARREFTQKKNGSRHWTVYLLHIILLRPRLVCRLKLVDAVQNHVDEEVEGHHELLEERKFLCV